jgi:hypothetical protein
LPADLTAAGPGPRAPAAVVAPHRDAPVDRARRVFETRVVDDERRDAGPREVPDTDFGCERPFAVAAAHELATAVDVRPDVLIDVPVDGDHGGREAILPLLADPDEARLTRMASIHDAHDECSDGR